MIDYHRIAATDERFGQVLELRYRLLDEPLGVPQVCIIWECKKFSK